MREQFHGELAEMTESMVEMTRLAGFAMSRATQALLETDLALAEGVIAADSQINDIQIALEEKALSLIARQAPVATDLRVLFTSLRITSDIERMGDLARHVAKVTRLRFPHPALPDELRSTFAEMGEAAQLIAAKTGEVIATRDIDLAGELEQDDDAMDALHRKLFSVLVAPEWTHGTETAVDITLCGRYYERFADHGVSVARRIVFLVTGRRADLD